MTPEIHCGKKKVYSRHFSRKTYSYNLLGWTWILKENNYDFKKNPEIYNLSRVFFFPVCWQLGHFFYLEYEKLLVSMTKQNKWLGPFHFNGSCITSQLLHLDIKLTMHFWDESATFKVYFSIKLVKVAHLYEFLLYILTKITNFRW